MYNLDIFNKIAKKQCDESFKTHSFRCEILGYIIRNHFIETGIGQKRTPRLVVNWFHKLTWKELDWNY
jgi:hypothetical protein